MSDRTTEHAFETDVEAAARASGLHSGTNAEWDVEKALFSARVCSFL